MKIQDTLSGSDLGRAENSGSNESSGEEHRGQHEDVHWGEKPQDNGQPSLSAEHEGLLICQFQEDDSDPMLSPRHYALEHCQECDDDTEVPPSPPSTHSFISVPSRQRSSSLGSYGDSGPKLSSAQYAKKIHALRRKIRKFEERFEEEYKYRPSYSDKAANPDVLRWIHELSRLQRDFKERRMRLSEDDVSPVGRQRSNTLPPSFGSQLEREPQDQEPVENQSRGQEPLEHPPQGQEELQVQPQEWASLQDQPQAPGYSMMDSMLVKWRKRREDTSIPEDNEDVAREQVGAEKEELQRALLYYGSVHGRLVAESEKEMVKPLYERYRLLKQILCRASAIPAIEEEDGPEDDEDAQKEFDMTVMPSVGMVALLDHLNEEADDFILPINEPSISENSADSQLSNLHLTTMPELVEQLQKTRADKRRMRQRLREFDDAFFKQNGRNAQKEDRCALAKEYNDYKHVKAKLRLLEVLISKKDSSVFL